MKKLFILICKIIAYVFLLVAFWAQTIIALIMWDRRFLDDSKITEDRILKK